MIRIVGAGGGSETQAAQSLKTLILDYWPWVESDSQCDIRLIVGTNCVGQHVEDIDLVLLGVFAKPVEIPLHDRVGLPVGSFLIGGICAVIEIKEHGRDSIALQGDSLLVRYRDQWKNATEQNRKQLHALANVLESRGVTRPFIQKFVWLTNVDQQELLGDRGAALPYLLFRDSSWRRVLTAIWSYWRTKHPNAQGFGDGSYFISADISSQSPADFDGIARVLTSEGLPLKPATFEDHWPESQPFVKLNHSPERFSKRSDRRGQLSFRTMARVAPALVIAGLIATVGLIAGLNGFSRWLTITPSSRSSSNTNTKFLNAFAGSYGCTRKSALDVVTVSAAADHLNISSGSGGAELWPLAGNEFRSVNATTGFKGKVVFAKGANGRVLNLAIFSDQGQKVVCPITEVRR